MSLRKLARSVQPQHLMAQATRCGCSVGSVMAPAHASSVCRSAALALKARQESGRCAEPNKPIQPWRGEMSEKAVPDTLHSPVKGLDQGKRSMVFVLDKHKKPLMPCTPKKARLLLSRGRAVVHRRYPFVIRLKDRRVEESVMQPLVLKIDPGARTSGMAVVRVEATPQGEVHHGVHLAEVRHRGEQVHAAMGTRARARRRRR